MLIQPDAKKLGDGLLSGEESLRKLFEDTDRRLQVYRLTDHEELKDEKTRTGTPMFYTELIRKVIILNPSIFAEDSINSPGNVGLYMPQRVVHEWDRDKKYLVAFQKSVLPEFSIIITDNADLAIKEIRGWRTVLLRLIQTGALTLRQALEVFGDAHGIASDRWRRYVQPMR